MRPPRLQTVVVVRHRDSRAADHDRLRALAAELVHTPSDEVALAQRCDRCADPGHGPLSVSGTRVPVRVSLARAGDVVVLAATTGPVVGVDAEWVRDVAAAPLDAWSADERRHLHRSGGTAAPGTSAAVLPGAGPTTPGAGPTTPGVEPSTPGAADAARTALWTAKEAVLKADGRGLRVDPAAVSLRWRGAVGRVTWDDGPVWTRALRIRHLALDEGGLVLALATVGRTVVRLVDDRA